MLVSTFELVVVTPRLAYFESGVVLLAVVAVIQRRLCERKASEHTVVTIVSRASLALSLRLSSGVANPHSLITFFMGGLTSSSLLCCNTKQFDSRSDQSGNSIPE